MHEANHIEVHVHYLRQTQEEGSITFLEKRKLISSLPLSKEKIEKFKELLGMKENDFPLKGSVGNLNGKPYNMKCNYVWVWFGLAHAQLVRISTRAGIGLVHVRQEHLEHGLVRACWNLCHKCVSFWGAS